MIMEEILMTIGLGSGFEPHPKEEFLINGPCSIRR